MTDIVERAMKALEGTTDGEWHLYVDEDRDAIAVTAWGVRPNGGHFSWYLARMPLPDKHLTREQINANARFIAFARTGVPELVEEVKRLREALGDAREDIMWSAYGTGAVKDGRWSHLFMSDGEWLARELGFDPKQSDYDDEVVKAAIPVKAREVTP